MVISQSVANYGLKEEEQVLNILHVSTLKYQPFLALILFGGHDIITLSLHY